MQHPITDRDQSAFADSINRLTIEMREMLGMGPAADIPHVGADPAKQKSTPRWTPSDPPRLPLVGRLTASVARRDAARLKNRRWSRPPLG